MSPFPALVTILAAILLAPPCAAALPPAPQAVTINYDMYRDGLHIATMNESFEAKGGEYQLTSVTRAVGLATLVYRQPLRVTSNGRIVENGLQPQRYEGKRGDADPRQARAEFDWPAGRVTLTHDGKTDNLAVAPGAQDRLSLMYQFMFLAPSMLQRLDFTMTNGRKLDRYRYAVNPGVEIDTPLGRMSTLHLVKQHRADESGAEVWLSPQHRYLPVKVLVIEEDGTRYEQVATRLEIRDAAP